MINFALFVLVAWAPLSLLFFVFLPARRAAVVGAIAGWLIVPPMQIDFAGFPGYNKTLAVTLGVLLGTLFFESDRLLRFRFRWFDLPILLWCLCPSVATLANGFGGLEPISGFIG